MTFTSNTQVPSYLKSAIADGYIFECSCGELYNSVQAATSCRKCRDYCVFGYCTHVVNVATSTLVYGEVPDYEEYTAAESRATARWAEEKAELDLYAQMLAKEGDLYSAELARVCREARVAASNLAEDRAWSTQDRLMGV